MSPQLIYTLLFFVPFILLLIFAFLIAKKIIKLGLFVLVIAVILFFVFSVKISPLDYVLRYDQTTDTKSMDIGKYTLTFSQKAGENFYTSYLKIYDKDTKKENTIVLDPNDGKYWNVDIKTENDNVCFYNVSKKLFCINKKDWTISYADKTEAIQEVIDKQSQQ
jgi:hypothetical protein